MSVEQFPTRSAFRFEILKAALRPADTNRMSTPEVAALCEGALPDCTVDEIIQALKEVAEEHEQEADRLQRLKASRGEAGP